MNTQTKTVLKTTLFTIAIGGMISVFSCRKDNVASKTEAASSVPITHDKPYTFNSNTNKEVGILIEDANGVLRPLDKTPNKNGAMATSTCNDDSYLMKLVYRGYTISSVCFNEPVVGSYMTVSWDLYLPEDVNIVLDATCNTRVKVGPAGFVSTPTGTGFRTLGITQQYIETVDIDGSGTMMKKWRITSAPTPFSESDYCGNLTITPTFKIKTDCLDIPVIQPAIITDYMDVNSRSIPDLWAQAGMTSSGGNKIDWVPNIPLCGPSCHGYWDWATNFEIQYKKTTDLSWITRFQYSSTVVTISQGVASGTYEYRYRALIRGALGGADAVWSDWQVSYLSPTVTVP